MNNQNYDQISTSAAFEQLPHQLETERNNSESLQTALKNAENSAQDFKNKLQTAVVELEYYQLEASNYKNQVSTLQMSISDLTLQFQKEIDTLRKETKVKS